MLKNCLGSAKIALLLYLSSVLVMRRTSESRCAGVHTLLQRLGDTVRGGSEVEPIVLRYVMLCYVTLFDLRLGATVRGRREHGSAHGVENRGVKGKWQRGVRKRLHSWGGDGKGYVHVCG
jgi:hypothetical protein